MIDWRFYRVLFSALTPLLVAYTAWQALQNRDGRYLRERFGRFGAGQHVHYWLHGASVGEINAVAPLVKEICKHYPNCRLLVTTVTPSGAKTVRERLPPSVVHAYLPLDYPRAMRAFLRRFQPRCALVMETELWPALFRACEEADVPIAIINGRLSPRTLRAAAWIRRLYAACLARTRCVLTRSEGDRLDYIQLGACTDVTRCIGNIKFAATDPDRPVLPIDLGRPYLLAASTREEEEKVVVRAWRKATSDHLLVIVPRHPRRLPAILHDLAGTRLAVRSRGEAPTTDTEVYIADTFGELERFIAGAELVFMGGSLVPKGGQNLLEPATQGKATIVGPHMANFETETALLKEVGAVRQVASEEELADTLRLLLGDPLTCRRMGDAARQAVRSRSDIAERYLAELELCLPDAFAPQ